MGFSSHYLLLASCTIGTSCKMKTPSYLINILEYVLFVNASLYIFYFLFTQGRNRNGQIGYFPESYVQISASPPSTISGANSVPDNLSQDIVIATEISQNEHRASKYFRNFLQTAKLTPFCMLY